MSTSTIVSRRSFLASTFATAGAAVVGEASSTKPVSPTAAAQGVGGAPNLVFGVVSDVHVRSKGEEATLAKALEFFRDAGADGVVIAGDIADSGRVSQLELVANAWNNVFPGGKAPDGRPVERLFVYGNHDVLAWSWGGAKSRYTEEELRAQAIGYKDNRACVWERIFGEKYEPIWAKTVKGYVFTGAHWGCEKGLDQFLQENADRLGLRGTKPFFHIQHPHPSGTVQGPWAWGRDGGAATQALEKCPNSVAFSGHSHYSITDERSIWQGSFTSVGTGSLKYIFSQYWRENGEGNDHGGKPSQMPILPEGKGRQGMVVRVYDDRMTFERREFVFGERLGPDWVVPLDGSRPYAFAPRREKAVAPEFAQGATVTVERLMGKNRQGKEVDQVVVSFPAAKPSETSRVHDYEVAALAYHEDVDYPVSVKRVHSESFFLPPTREAESGRIVFAADELENCVVPVKGVKSVRFAVRPVECFGRKGHEILSEPFVLSPRADA